MTGRVALLALMCSRFLPAAPADRPPKLGADGVPWGTTVKITSEWQEIRIPLADFTFFRHCPDPQARGGEGDSPQGAETRSVGLCFGAWQYPETRAAPHGFAIQSVGLE